MTQPAPSKVVLVQSLRSLLLTYRDELVHLDRTLAPQIRELVGLIASRDPEEAGPRPSVDAR